MAPGKFWVGGGGWPRVGGYGATFLVAIEELARVNFYLYGVVYGL